jgi:hypothetical protein
MSLGISVLIVLLASVAFFVVKGQLSVGGRFWRRVARKPDLAVRLMRGEAGCIVDGEPRDGYVGPFRFADSGGHKHRVYIKTRINDIQRRLLDELH